MTTLLTFGSPPPNEPAGEEPNRIDDDLRYRRGHRLPTIGWVGSTLILTFIVMGLTAPRIAGYRVIQLAGKPLRPPTSGHLLGTNQVGQDLATQLFYGARTSLFMAAVAGGGTVLAGLAVGMVAGWVGGGTDAVLMRVADLFLVIPSLPLLIVLTAYVGPSTTGIAVIIMTTAWPGIARVIRAQVMSLRPRDHLRAAVGFGAGTGHVLRRHVLPEVGLLAAALFIGAASRAVMVEAGLAFLGLGDPLRPSWGRTMRDALDFKSLFFTPAWSWWLLPPVLCLALLLLGLTFSGMALEQRIAPRLVRHGMRRRASS